MKTYGEALIEQAGNVHSAGLNVQRAVAGLYLELPQQYQEEVWQMQVRLAELAKEAEGRIVEKAKDNGWVDPLVG